MSIKRGPSGVPLNVLTPFPEPVYLDGTSLNSGAFVQVAQISGLSASKAGGILVFWGGTLFPSAADSYEVQLTAESDQNPLAVVYQSGLVGAPGPGQEWGGVRWLGPAPIANTGGILTLNMRNVSGSPIAVGGQLAVATA